MQGLVASLGSQTGLVRTSPSDPHSVQYAAGAQEDGSATQRPRCMMHAAYLLLAALALGIKVRVEGQLQGFLVQVSLLPRVQHLGGALRVGQGAG